MNSPNPTGTVNVPAVTPTFGAILGSIVTTAVLPHIGDPVGQYAAGSAITALFTWLAHFAHSKLGTPE